jgi:hypothetical protein
VNCDDSRARETRWQDVVAVVKRGSVGSKARWQADGNPAIVGIDSDGDWRYDT